MTDADAAPGSVGVVVVAAGSGSRLGAGVPKAFVRLHGRPLLAYAVDTVARLPHLRSVVVVAPLDHAAPRDAADPVWEGVELPSGAVVVAGGAERTDSVAAGLAAVDATCDVVLVHDAARCLTPLDVFERVVEAVRRGAAGAVPGLPVVDTVKSVDAEGVITGTPDRASLRAVQTPQGFRREVLATAYGSGLRATDDAALVERCGHHVVVVAGDPLAFKVTTPDDLERAERLLARAGRR
ncbi:2-C-methyl-D-erythritol 4-phosphate cytidylyltransferase [Fodinibacter luteus]|uniref:2-C-methyl-D-erythritol 4-phosphate cytidylyltransferase n=1 Tax=Fodinibacter luteus TaxID=552064 RepID=A0ABP8KN94_9MICO